MMNQAKPIVRMAVACASAALGLCATAEAKETAQAKETPTPARPAASAPETITALTFEGLGTAENGKPQPIVLLGRDARRQLLLVATLDGGSLRDMTRNAAYAVAPEGVVTADPAGYVIPMANGSATITAKVGDKQAAASVTVSQFGDHTPVSFANQVVPVFTRFGCNSGACHGKAEGQNGFRLSLLGFEPAEDYEHLVNEARGRRLFPAAPAQSLLLRKPAGTVPHEGGTLFDTGSREYGLIHRWIADGMIPPSEDEPKLTRIEVFPSSRVLRHGDQQQLGVLARYSNGVAEDITRVALYEANDKQMAEADRDGLVQILDGMGDVAVMVRFQDKAGVFRARVPLGAPVQKLPAPKNFIDELVFKKLKLLGLPPSEPCDDATFLRRASLDIAGRLPTLAEANAFLAGTDPNKRSVWIDTLLESGDYADYFANKWSALLRNRRNRGTDARGTFAFHSWLRTALYENKPYDRVVRGVLTASGDIGQNPPVAWYRAVRDIHEQLEDTAQLFLGVRMKCARCHHHPFEKWSQDDYYGLAAFFSRIGRKAGSRPGEEVIFHNRGVAGSTNPRTKRAVPPAGLGAEPLEIPPDQDPRQALVDWLVQKDNPFFARILVNRYWKHFFGRALVEPEDDMRETNPASNPELLDALAGHFIDSGFDLKDLVRTICNARTYQLSSIPNEHNADDRQNHSRYYPKRLQAEVLLDAINAVTNADTRFAGLPAGTRGVQLPDNSFNDGSYLLRVFGRPEMKSACECERTQDASLAQSLHLLNSRTVQGKLTADNSRAAVLAGNKDATDEANIRELYLRAFARPPEPEELSLAVAHVKKKTETEKDKDGKPTPDVGRRQAYEDLVWALINTKEFLFNH